jgi:uncharacterized protein (TIGR01777 family)
MPVFSISTELPVSAERAYDWHAQPGAIQRLTPPWEDVRLVSKTGGLEDGARVVLSVPLLGPLRMNWVAEHRNNQPGRQFQDIQLSGPFARWEHTHRFTPLGPDRCQMTDEIHYALPLGLLGQLFGGPMVRAKLQRMFTYRHQQVLSDLTFLSRGDGPLKILLSGASGMVGRALTQFLATGGHTVTPLVRRKPRANEVQWDPATGFPNPEAAEGFDAVVHLAGENIAEGRWTEEKKARIKDSRVIGTRTLSEALAKLKQPPKTLVSASAIGYYGSRGDQVLTEVSPAGDDFLARVCRGWEAGTEPAAEAGIRVVRMRIGIILSTKGGALAKMLPIFQLGGGGVLGSGKQYMSWVALDDVVGALHHALVNEELRGPVNVVAPNPVTNAEFTKVLGRVLFRPTFAPVPAIGLKVLLGEMADALLLSSTRVEPVRLQESGYPFQYPDLQKALKHVLGK